MIYLLYLLILLPWLTDYLESNRLPATLRELLTEISLTLLIGLGVHLLIRQNRRARRQSAEMERLAITDPLTGLGNSRSLQETVIREVARARRMERPLSCVLLDLDDFRMINDRFGHERGNQVLQVVARTIGEMIRRVIDRAFRYGGDEFLILLPEADTTQALAVAQRLRQALLALRPPTIPKKSLSASFGVAELRKEQRAEDLLRTMDRALFQAKAKGKNIIYNAELLDS